MVRLVLLLLGALIAAQAAASPHERSSEKPRIALIIGNANYRQLPALRNPVNDARDMCRTLEGLGFQSQCLYDIATARDMRDAVRSFVSRLQRGATGLFYYAGHAVQVGFQNYLLPIDAEIHSRADVDFEGFSLRYLMTSLIEARNSPNILILDACRDNPFSGALADMRRDGLARMDPPSGSMIVYATAPNDVALDGAGENGLFTSHLLEHLPTPGLSLDETFRRVSEAVELEARHGYRTEQTPFRISSYSGNFCFAGCEPGTDPLELARIKSQQLELQERLNLLQDENARLRQKALAGNAEIGKLEQRIAALTQETATSREDQARIALQLEEARTSLETLVATQDRREHLEQENAEAREQLETLNRLLGEREQALDSMTSQIERLQARREQRPTVALPAPTPPSPPPTPTLAAQQATTQPPPERPADQPARREIIIPSF